MPAFSPIAFLEDGSYAVCLVYNKPGSNFIDYEWINRRFMDTEIKEGAVRGEVITPFISHGLH